MGTCYTKIKIQQLTIPSGNGYTSFISVTARNFNIKVTMFIQDSYIQNSCSQNICKHGNWVRILVNITILVRIAVNKGYVHNSCKLYSTVIVVVAVNISVKVMVALNIIEYIRYSNCKPHSYCHCSCKHYSLVMDAVKIAVIMIIDYDHDYHRCWYYSCKNCVIKDYL